MPRLSIDISTQEHQQLKAIAALNGQSIKQFVLSRTLSDIPETLGDDAELAYRELAELLAPSIAEARAGKAVYVSAEDIQRSARAKRTERDA